MSVRLSFHSFTPLSAQLHVDCLPPSSPLGDDDTLTTFDQLYLLYHLPLPTQSTGQIVFLLAFCTAGPRQHVDPANVSLVSIPILLLRNCGPIIIAAWSQLGIYGSIS